MVDYDLSKIKLHLLILRQVLSMDFQTSEQGNEEVLEISIKMGDDFKVYGCGEYTPSNGVMYVKVYS